MKITRKGQVTIPKWARDRFGIQPGTEIHFKEWEHHIVLEKAGGEAHPFREVYGLLKRPQSTDHWLKQLRGQ